MNRSTPGLPVHHQLPEFTETHVHRINDAIQPSHPLSSPSPLAPNPSQHQSFPMSQLFAWGGQSTGVSALASFLPLTPYAYTFSLCPLSRTEGPRAVIFVCFPQCFIHSTNRMVHTPRNVYWKQWIKTEIRGFIKKISFDLILKWWMVLRKKKWCWCE